MKMKDTPVPFTARPRKGLPRMTWDSMHPIRVCGSLKERVEVCCQHPRVAIRSTADHRSASGAASQALVRKANRANVPVVAYDSLPMNADVAAFVARDAVSMAIEIAEAAVMAHPKGNYILALGDEGTNVAQEEKQGYYKVLKPYLDRGDIKIVSEQFNKNWSTESGRAQVENALTKTNNDVVAVLAGNDGVAYGVIQALQGQGLAGKVWVNGVDAEPRSRTASKAPRCWAPFTTNRSGCARCHAPSELAGTARPKVPFVLRRNGWYISRRILIVSQPASEFFCECC